MLWYFCSSKRHRKDFQCWASWWEWLPWVYCFLIRENFLLFIIIPIWIGSWKYCCCSGSPASHGKIGYCPTAAVRSRFAFLSFSRVQDSDGNSDSFYRARESNAGFRASVFANPMVKHFKDALFYETRMVWFNVWFLHRWVCKMCRMDLFFVHVDFNLYGAQWRLLGVFHALLHIFYILNITVTWFEFVFTIFCDVFFLL